MAQGSIDKRLTKSGDVRYDAIFRDPFGRQITKTFNAKKEAERFLADRTAKIFDGTYRRIRPITFSEFAETWLLVKKSTIRMSSYSSLEYKVRKYLIEHLGPCRMSDITPEMIDGVRASVSHLSFSTRKKVNQFLSAMFKKALISHVVAEDPTLTTERFKNIRPTEYTILSPKQIGELRAVARLSRRHQGGGHKALPPAAVELYYLLSIYAGLRPEESVGLTRDRVNLEKRTIAVDKTIYYFRTDKERAGNAKAWMFQECKTRAAYRTIPIGRTLYEAIQIHLIEAPENPHNLLIATASGSPVCHNNLTERYFQPDLKRAGLPRMKFYELRHTFCSLLVASGERNFKRIQYLMGHANVATTLQIYSHLLPEDNANVAERLDAYIQSNTHPTE